jgi:D-inositol-3-phosphate glycosyltransferase
MRIAIVGGIYGRDKSYRRNIRYTPETILEKGLIDRGHEVAVFSHYATFDAKKFDLIHVHHLSYGTTRVAVDNSNAAFVYTSHDGLAMSSLYQGYKRLASHFVTSRADAVVALSRVEADFQQRSYPLAGAIHTVIPNGVDAANYAYARCNAAGKGQRWRLLYVGQLTAPKSVDMLLRALLQVRQPVDLELVYHNSVLEIPLRELSDELGLSGRVRFLGPKTPQELAAIYKRADVLLLPSAGEALPSVVTEAMLCGTPVVATDVGGVREQLGEYGLCVSPNRADKMADAISFMLEHYDEFAGRSEAASAYASRRFSIEGMVDRHCELYANLLENKGPRRRHRTLHIPVNAVLKIGISLICATK